MTQECEISDQFEQPLILILFQTVEHRSHQKDRTRGNEGRNHYRKGWAVGPMGVLSPTWLPSNRCPCLPLPVSLIRDAKASLSQCNVRGCDHSLNNNRTTHILEMTLVRLLRPMAGVLRSLVGRPTMASNTARPCHYPFTRTRF